MTKEELIELYIKLQNYVVHLDCDEIMTENVIRLVQDDIAHALDVIYDIDISVSKLTRTVIVKDNHDKETK